MDLIRDFLTLTTSSEIKKYLLQTIQNFRNRENPTLENESEPAKAAYHQQRMGIRATCNGIWLNDWIHQQTLYFKKIRSTKCPKVWLTSLTIRLHRVLHSLWKTRNEAIHAKENSDNNKKGHNDLDQEIKIIFHRLPNLRLLPPSEATFLKRGEERVK